MKNNVLRDKLRNFVQGLLSDSFGDLLLITLHRLWQGLAGVITVSIAVHFLTPQELGAYYSFLSLAAVAMLFDFGLAGVLLQQSAHSFTQTKWIQKNHVNGVLASYIRDLAAKSLIWYTVISSSFLIFVLPCGFYFFGGISSLREIYWVGPWSVLVFVTALNVVTSPCLSLVEGSGRLKEVYMVKLLQSMVGAVTCWLLLLSGGKLWSVVAIPAASAFIGGIWAVRWYKAFPKFSTNNEHCIHWRTEIWPFQWRTGVGMVCAYLQTQFFSLVLIKTQGPVLSGQMGLSLTIVNMLVLLSQPWLIRKIPALTQAASNCNQSEMDRIFFPNLAGTFMCFVFGVIIVILAMLMFPESKIVRTVLPMPEFICLTIALLANLVFGSFSLYLRSFRREPFLQLYVFTTVLLLPVGFFAASEYSSLGVVLVMIFFNGLIILPYALFSWRKLRKEYLV